MPKINLTHKTTAEQIRIVKNYLIRRSKHHEQGDITIDQLVKRFKHNRLISDKAKYAHFDRIYKMIEKEEEKK